MTETLVLRWPLPSQSEMLWLVSTNDNTIIASGSSTIEQVEQLSTQAQNRKLVILVPARLCRVVSLELAKSAQRKWRQLAVYMLEDELADDPENMHIALLSKSGDKMQFVVCQRQLMKDILSRFGALQLSPSQIIPDALLLNQEQSDSYSLLQIQSEYLLSGPDSFATSIDASQLNFVLDALAHDGTEHNSSEDITSADITSEDNTSDGNTLDHNALDYDAPSLTPHLATRSRETVSSAAERVLTLNAYSTFSLSPGLAQKWQLIEQQATLPMELLVRGLKRQTFSLQQGEFEIANPWANALSHWKKVAVAAALCASLLGLEQYLTVRQLQLQSEQATQNLRDFYQQVFPNVTRFRDSQIRRDLRAVVAQENQSDPSKDIEILIDLVPAFAKVPDLNVTSFRFDKARGELRVLALAKNYQSFDNFARIASDFDVEQGAMNQVSDRVQGSLIIRSRR